MVLSHPLTNAQNDSSSVIINKINISGNKKTKDRIILRELTFRENESVPISGLMSKLEQSRKNIYNLNLFSTVVLNIKNWEQNKVNVDITVEERWYTYPFPVFELADRNFNVWWNQIEPHRDLRRTEYGIRFIQANTTGRNDWLRVSFRLGYSRKLETSYNLPYIDKKLHTGLSFFFSYSQNKQIAYITQDNKQLFFPDPFVTNAPFIRERFVYGITLTHRPIIHHTHFIEGRYHQNWIDHTIANLNSDYFLNGNQRQQFFFLRYAFENDFRDVKQYPLKGHYLYFEIAKTGLIIFPNEPDITTLTAEGRKFWQLSANHFLSGQLKAMYSTPEKQPYFNQKAFGFKQDFVRGYEYYVVDGQRFTLLKSTYKFKLAHFEIHNSGFLPKKFNTIPYNFYLKTYCDIGYVYDNYAYKQWSNPLNNNWLAGTGIGLDIVTIYDMLFRMEYSINLKKEHSLFLHFKVDI